MHESGACTQDYASPQPSPLRGEGAPGSRGQSLAEYALTLLLFLIVVLGILDLGRVFYAHNVIANAAREGARRGIITPDAATVESVVRASAVGLDRTQLDVIVTPSSDLIQVTVHYRFYPVTPLISQLIGGHEYVTVTTSAAMKVE